MIAFHDAVERWIADDPDPTTRRELQDLLDKDAAGDTTAAEQLEDRFKGFLTFGTAGLRGALGAGPNRMNRAVVIRAAAGLAGYLTETLGGPGATIVIGYDARHRSYDFARSSAAVFVGAGHRALLLPGALPTPVLAYATKELGADAGVMVTASHNPAGDNGYKVYLGGRVVTDHGQGAQIVPPFDSDISAKIADVPSVASVPMPEGGWELVERSVVDSYISRTAAVVAAPEGATAARRAALSMVLTPLHGVGGPTLDAVFAQSGFTSTRTVVEQAKPDPNFPTVRFPNPEEDGALDLSIALARKTGADLIIANDPDADRCAVALPIDGQWQMLHGDKVGCLLGEYAASLVPAAQKSAGAALASSIVSSQMLEKIAARHGLAYAATLTGFKWIGRTPGLVFGYEEALGYCVAPDMVRDKDGVSAAVMIAEIAAMLKSAGRTLADALVDLDRVYGVHLSRQISARYDDSLEIEMTMLRLVQSPPESLAGSPVVTAEDLSEGVDGLPGTTGLRIRTESGARVIIRPSGTEPKLKTYLEVARAAQDDVAAGREAAAAEMDALERDMRLALGLRV